MNTAIVEVQFKVSATLRHGEEVRVSGNVPALGCNNPNRAVRLFTSPSEFPWWSSNESLFLPGDRQSVMYRYCIYTGGKFSRWEDPVRTRYLTAPKTEYLNSIIDQFGVYPDQVVPLSPNTRDGIVREQSVKKGVESHSFKARQFSEWGRRATLDNNLGSTDGVIMVSYFLPVILHKENGQWSASWDEENILSLNLNIRVTWVGSVRYAGSPIPIEEEEAVTAVLARMNCCPIFIHQNMHYQFYDVFCKQNLWLPMHQIGDVFGPVNLSDIGAKSQQDLWFTYSTVNRLFKDKVVESFHQGSMVWIHGFHLMLLPSFLRRVLQSARIGYFFHTPFPSSEIWKTIPRRDDLLRGILAADQIGFHLFEYARHFLSSCHRLLGYSAEMSAGGLMTISADGRDVVIACIHVGIDLDRLNFALESEEVELGMYKWKSRFLGRKIISGIDKLERLKGIPLKLKAIDGFLSENPLWLNKVVFVIIGISAAERGFDYHQTLHDVKITVAQINEKYKLLGSTDEVIHFEEKNEKEMKLPQRLAYFGASDAFMSIAARDGLNRFPMEYTLAKQRVAVLRMQNPDESNPLFDSPYQGPLILSEFISSARVMRGAFTVNPWKLNEIIRGIKIGLEMSDVERADRFRRNLEFSTRLTTTAWATQVLQDLKTVEKTDDHLESFGFGTGFRVMGVRAGFLPLDVSLVNKAYRVARNRLILLDWGGTLVADHDKTDKLHAYALAQGHQVTQESLTETMKDILETLCSDPKNTVFVVSGKQLHHVSNFFGDIQNLGLAAEHGCFYRWPRDEAVRLPADVNGNSQTTSIQAKWQSMLKSGDQSWKEAAKKMMEIYVQRTHGTYIEQKGNAVIWQFRDADPEFGYLQSKELEQHLSGAMASYGEIEVLRGGGVADGYIEVRPAGLSKGIFLRHATELMDSLKKSPDFVLAIGDDTSDEPMFAEIASMQQPESGSSNSGDNSMFSITVGKKPSLAHAYLDDPAAVLELLNILSKSADRDRRYYSTIDLSSHLQGQLDIGASSGSPINRVADAAKGKRASIGGAPVTQTPFGIGSSRAISACDLRNSAGGNEFLKKPSKKVEFIDSPAPRADYTIPAGNQEPQNVMPADSNTSQAAALGPPVGFARTESSAHLSMAQYFNSIESDEQDDDGIFF